MPETGPGRIHIRVDVDTHTGLRDGVPVLLDLLARLGIRAAFFVTMGPDNSGRAIRRVFTRKGFARKMARTGALETYGLYTVLSGTLLPSRPVGHGFPHLLRLIESGGHECGIHGWDHVLWHDRLERMGEGAIEGELRRAASAFADATGHDPGATAAPAWRATTGSLQVQDRLPFLRYASDGRGTRPCRIRLPDLDAPLRLVQMPTTLPTLDEMLGGPGMDRDAIETVLSAALRPGGWNVFTVHTEVEGRRQAGFLEGILRRWLAEGWSFERLDEGARRAAADPGIPATGYGRGEVAGRAGWVFRPGARPATSQRGAGGEPLPE